MKEAFKNHIEQRFPFLQQSKFLVAVSGGRDSVALVYLLHELRINFAIAHCNFNLRAAESDGDAQFVEELGEKFDIEVFSQRFDTEGFAAAEGISIQMAARELRYAWFEELCSSLNYDYVLTAHHAQDDLETFLININRASGLDGLTGIPVQNNRILRPFLPFSRKQIDQFISENNIEWREDSSNFSDKYLRNHIRHHVIPPLEEGAPQFLEQFAKTQKHLQENAALLQDYTALLYSKIVTETFKGYQLNISALKEVPNTKAVLYQLLKDFDFTAWDDIYELLNAQSGKYISSGSYRLIKDRDFLLLTEEKGGTINTFKLDENVNHFEVENINLSIELVDSILNVENTTAIFDKEMLKYPLVLRKWQEADYFYPFGMRGKKKVSKFFKDEKFSTLDKENTWLLCSGKDIIWVVGHRTDERYKVKPGAQNLLKFTATYV